MNEDEEIYTPGSLIHIKSWYVNALYIIVKSWRINSHQYMYRVLCENGSVYETRRDPESWRKIA